MVSRLAIGLVALAVAVSPQFIVRVDPPIINALTPNFGLGGSAVVMSGQHFGPAQENTVLTLNGVAVTTTAWSDTSVTFTVPVVVAAGARPVVMVRGGVASNTVTYTVSNPSPPTIISLSVSSGPIGTPVIITGTNFGSTQNSSLVFFNGVPATSYPSWSATSITTAVPSGATTGLVTVLVLGSTSNGLTFTVTGGTGPVLTSLSVPEAAPGATVTLTGSDFGATQGGSTVSFNGTTSTVIDAWTQASITAVVPTGASTGNVTVTVGGNTSAGLSLTVNTVTLFYVDAGRTANGTGTAASPWKLRSNIVWANLTTALATTDVIVYFSSRTRWNDAELFQVGADGTSSHRLTIDGMHFFNTVASGTANWQAETAGIYPPVGSSKATFRTLPAAGLAAWGSATTHSGAIYMCAASLACHSFFTIRGIYMDHPAYGTTLDTNGSHNNTGLANVTLEFDVIDTTLNSTQGMYTGGCTTGCLNYTVRHCAVMDVDLEGIYVQQFDYLADTSTGNIIEYNTVLDAGLTDEGDIDIKPSNFGAIVRYNYNADSGTGGASGGVVVFASDVQVYGNELHNIAVRSGDGYGIHLEAAGDGAGHGKTVNNILVYNNLIYSNASHGIAAFATQATSGNITNLKILNNTIVSNAGNGIHLSASPGTITISSLKNNIIASNTGVAVNVANASASITASNFNIFYKVGTPLLTYQGTSKTLAQWQALGFDANSSGADPVLDGTFHITTGSPAFHTGTILTELTVDKTGVSRTAPWNMGVYQP